MDLDPQLAFRHAEAARRRAGRLPIVREAAAETAYAAGEYGIALREFRAIRRMSGGDELIPVIADCERALGRPRDALEILNELDPRTKDIWLRIECLLVEAGVRDDLGQRPEALRLLQAAISRKVGPPFGQARLRYAYANLLEEDGDLDGARQWFTSAAALDQNTELDTADRIANLDGVVLPDFTPDEDEDEDEDEPSDGDVDDDDDAQDSEEPDSDDEGAEVSDAEDIANEDDSDDQGDSEDSDEDVADPSDENDTEEVLPDDQAEDEVLPDDEAEDDEPDYDELAPDAVPAPAPSDDEERAAEGRTDDSQVETDVEEEQD
ncbi:hypothetical protein [Tessaracoccus sp. Z1128]